MKNEEIERNLYFIEEQNNIILRLLYQVLINQGVEEKNLIKWIKTENKKIDKKFNKNE